MLDSLLAQLAVGVSSNAVWAAIAEYFSRTPEPTVEGLHAALAPRLEVQDADIAAGAIIEYLANRGDITIRGSRIYAGQAILYESGAGSVFEVGDGTVSSTPHTEIRAGLGASIRGEGGAGLRQNEDGSITFFT